MTKATLLMVGLLLAVPFCLLAEKPKHDADLTKKIEKVLREVQQIKVGMTRADLLKVFTAEGGCSNRNCRRYVHQRCPYIKVDLEFKPVGKKKDLVQENAADKITKISKPFLEWSIMD